MPRVGLFLHTHTQARAWAFPTLLQYSPRLRLSHSSAAYPLRWMARLSSVLVPYGIYRVHERRMKSAGVEGAYVWCQLDSAFSPFKFVQQRRISWE